MAGRRRAFARESFTWLERGKNWIYAHIRISNRQTLRARSNAHKFPSTLNIHFWYFVLCLQKKIGFLFPLGLIRCYVVTLLPFMKNDPDYGHVDETCYELQCDSARGNIKLVTSLPEQSLSVRHAQRKTFPSLKFVFLFKVSKISYFGLSSELMKLQKPFPFMLQHPTKSGSETAQNPLTVFYANEMLSQKLFRRLPELRKYN